MRTPQILDGRAEAMPFGGRSRERIAEAPLEVIVQRLLRRICPSGIASADSADAHRRQLNPRLVEAMHSLKHGDVTGEKKRTGISGLLIVDRALSDVMAESPRSDEIRAKLVQRGFMMLVSDERRQFSMEARPSTRSSAPPPECLLSRTPEFR